MDGFCTHFPADDHDAAADRRLSVDTDRLELSDLQWLAMLARLQESVPPHQGPDRRGQTPARERFGINARYLLHLPGHVDRGTFAVRARNLSARGMGFVHSEALPRDAPCTVLLTDHQDGHLIVTARVAWQRQVGEHLHDTGLSFDQPIDVLRFIEAD